jgi:hypothetical protein
MIETGTGITAPKEFVPWCVGAFPTADTLTQHGPCCLDTVFHNTDFSQFADDYWVYTANPIVWKPKIETTLLDISESGQRLVNRVSRYNSFQSFQDPSEQRTAFRGC